MAGTATPGPYGSKHFLRRYLTPSESHPKHSAGTWIRRQWDNSQSYITILMYIWWNLHCTHFYDKSHINPLQITLKSPCQSHFFRSNSTKLRGWVWTTWATSPSAVICYLSWAAVGAVRGWSACPAWRIAWAPRTGFSRRSGSQGFSTRRTWTLTHETWRKKALETSGFCMFFKVFVMGLSFQK